MAASQIILEKVNLPGGLRLVSSHFVAVTCTLFSYEAKIPGRLDPLQGMAKTIFIITADSGEWQEIYYAKHRFLEVGWKPLLIP